MEKTKFLLYFLLALLLSSFLVVSAHVVYQRFAGERIIYRRALFYSLLLLENHTKYVRAYLVYQVGKKYVATQPLAFSFYYGRDEGELSLYAGTCFLGLNPESTMGVYGVGYTVVRNSGVYVNTSLKMFSNVSEVHFTDVLFRYSGFMVFVPGYIYDSTTGGGEYYSYFGSGIPLRDPSNILNITYLSYFYKPIIFFSRGTRYVLNISFSVAVVFQRSGGEWKAKTYLLPSGEDSRLKKYLSSAPQPPPESMVIVNVVPRDNIVVEARRRGNILYVIIKVPSFEEELEELRGYRYWWL